MVRAELNNFLNTNSFVSKIPSELDLKNLDLDEDQFQSAIETYKDLGNLASYEIVTPGGDYGTITDRVYIAHDQSTSFIEANKVVTQQNKETVSNLLDFVCERNCEKLVVCVDRTHYSFKTIVASFLAIGFSMAPIYAMPGYVCLAQEL